MFLKHQNITREKGFSLLELAVAVGIAAIVAGVAVTASTVFVNGSQTKSEEYAASADSEIGNASARFDALWGEGGTPGGGTPGGGIPVATTPGVPSSFQVASTGTKGALLTWAAPTTGAQVESYQVSVNGSVVATLSSSTFEYTVTGLTSATTNNVIVSAVNAEGSSSTVETSFQTLSAPSPAPAIQTSSVQWNTVNQADGIIYGGRIVDYNSGINGLTTAAFDSLGASGMEWTSQWDPANREPYYGTVQSSSINPGGVSTWNTAGLISPLPEYNIVNRITQQAEHNQMSWNMAMTVLDEDALVPNRFFWVADLTSGYDTVFTKVSDSTIIIQDANGLKPTLVFTATTTAGTLKWAGSGIYSKTLINGEDAPTLYVYNTTARELQININLGIIDQDSCSNAEALSFAEANAGVYGVKWATIKNC
jgi:prepilin-type N-terminal cleavage/methylation domain-containing protein